MEELNKSKKVHKDKALSQLIICQCCTNEVLIQIINFGWWQRQGKHTIALWLSHINHCNRHYVWGPWFFTLTVDLHLRNHFLMCNSVFIILFSLIWYPTLHALNNLYEYKSFAEYFDGHLGNDVIEKRAHHHDQ